MVNIIHKNIYSNRLKTVEKFEPYVYEIKGDNMINSLMMFFSDFDSTILINAVKDFCETERSYISSEFENYIIYKRPYKEVNLRTDLKTLFSITNTMSKLNFFDICIANIENELEKSKEIFGENKYQMSSKDVCGPDYLIKLKRKFIDSLNEVFQHNNLGYQVINGVIVSKQSDFLHIEVISKPLTLLINEEFNGPLEEFKKGIDNYTHKDYENTVIEACKAFESTMKSVLDKLSVAYNHDKPTAKGLISLLKENGIFDSFQEDNLNKLTGVLIGLPTIRNRKSGHGDGIDKKEVERSYASFALNLAGSYIMFILDRYYETIE